MLKLLIMCDCYKRVVQYVHFSTFNFKMFFKGYELQSIFYKHYLNYYI